MKKSLHFFVFHCLLWVGLLQPDGFAEHTLVRYKHGLKPIEQFIVGNHVVVVTHGGKLQPYSIAQTMSYVAHYFIKIQIKDICVCAAPDQKFYSCSRQDWVSARSLQVSEPLLCGNGKIVYVDAVETVHKQQQMHTFSLETNHIFCVTPYEILAHNIEPVATTAGTVALTVACPPAGIALAVGQVVGLGVLACVMYCKHRSNSRTQIKNDGCFTPDSRNTTPIITGCHHPISDVPVVCDIRAGQADLPTKLVHEVPEQVRDTGCVFPAERQQPLLHNAAATQTEVDKKRYDGPTYHRTEDWVKEHPFGQKIKDCLERSMYVNQGKRAFEVLEDIEGFDGFKKGDFIVIDALHKDHLEVFGSNLKWKQVANLDGTKNIKKTEQGSKENRQPLRKG
jgi:hypothetical protein